MKTYILIVSRRFPKSHPRAGERTGFPAAIRNRFKIHTLRSNYPLWEKRFEQIDKGQAILSVRVWTGKPYRSKQREIFWFDKTDGIGLEKLTFSSGDFNCMLIDDEYCFTDTKQSIAKNDGLSFEDFRDWFRGYDLNEPMAVIHFTDFRYAK